jgi:osmotically-inducible protein OsmY
MGRRLTAETYGLAQQAQHVQPEHWSVPNDATLVQRVESELFRDPDVPKGRININAEAGMIALRGVLDRPEQIRAVENAVSRMPGVRGVQNLLHLPGTPVPNLGSVLPAS